MDSEKLKISNILLIEDDPGDQEITLRALETGKIKNKLFIVSDGDEALDFLFNRGKFSDPQAFPTPDLVLLDLNLPKKRGEFVLEEIRACEKFRYLPVVVLTTSKEETMIFNVYKKGANSYIVKPVEFSRFIQVINELEHYWFQLVVLPKAGR